jgi:hypothetical protein
MYIVYSSSYGYRISASMQLEVIDIDALLATSQAGGRSVSQQASRRSPQAAGASPPSFAAAVAVAAGSGRGPGQQPERGLAGQVCSLLLLLLYGVFNTWSYGHNSGGPKRRLLKTTFGPPALQLFQVSVDLIVFFK